MLTVLHVTQPNFAGVARCVEQIVGDQVSRGWSVHVACPGDGELASAVEGAGARHVEWGFRRKLASAPSAALDVRRLVREVSPDVVHLHSHKAGMAGRLAVRRRRPTIFHPNSWIFEEKGPWARLALSWERFAARWTSVLICASEGDRRRGEAAGIRGRKTVIHNAVDLSRFTPAGDGDRRDARHRLSLPTGPIVVCVGRLAWQKGQDVLLEAWPAVQAALPGAALYLVGDGPDLDALTHKGGSGVVFAGWRDDVADWLAAADVVVLPSRWEGMAYAPLEAMARQRSVVATDVAGAREAVGGDAGAVVPIGDPAALGHALVTRLRDPALAAAEGQAGRRRAEVMWDSNVFTAKIAALTLELAGR